MLDSYIFIKKATSEVKKEQTHHIMKVASGELLYWYACHWAIL